jgi:hypothetical protein
MSSTLRGALGTITKRKLSKKESDVISQFNASLRRREELAAASRKTAGKSAGSAIMPIGKIERAIVLVRGEKVILDADLAKLYVSV